MRFIMKNIDITSQLTQLTMFQKELLYREIIDYIQFNECVLNEVMSVCPVCGIKDPRIIKKGFLNGKQRYQCKECGHKFVSTRGKLNYNSKQSEEHLSMVILDTLYVIPLDQTASILDRCIPTVFNMRHKFLLLLEQFLFEQDEMMEEILEIDETYIPDSYKGIKRTNSDWLRSSPLRESGKTQFKGSNRNLRRFHQIGIDVDQRWTLLKLRTDQTETSVQHDRLGSPRIYRCTSSKYGK